MVGDVGRVLEGLEAILASGDEVKCHDLILGDEVVNRRERLLDEQAVTLLGKFKPTGADLRFVLATLRVAGNLERMGDESKTVARRLLMVGEPGPVDFTRRLMPLAAAAREGFALAARGFLNRDGSQLEAVKAGDRLLDELHRERMAELALLMEKDSAYSSEGLHLLVMVRSIERIGDHAKNIAEEAVFVEG